jgi:hypothetical protein
MRRASSVALAAAALVACDRPAPRVICHNGNCVEPADPEADDTIPALRESLALTYRGRPAIDGVEIDSFWNGAAATCLFAHDLERAPTTPAIEPAMELAARFAQPGPLTYGDGPFLVLHELKAHVSADKSDRHTPEQRMLHAACGWQVYTIIADAAAATGRAVELEFSSFEPELLRAVRAQTPAATPIPVRYGAVLGVPAPLDNQTQELGDYAGIPLDTIEIHAQWINDAQHEAVRSYGAELALWMFSATVETFATIDQYEPAVVVTNEARLFRRWLDW